MRIEAKESPASNTELAEETGTALALIGETTAALIYAPGALTALVDRLKAEVRGQLATLDVSIPKDKARIISLSARVATAKVKLDNLGDSLIEEHRAVVTTVNADRKAMRDDLDAFKIEVRKPVTDLENAEKVRIGNHEAAIKLIEEAPENPALYTIEDVEGRIAYVNQIADRDWEEFSKRATGAKALAMQTLTMFLQAMKQAEADRIEAERLAAEAREQAIKEREESAAKAAKEEAERKAALQARIAHLAAEELQRRVENERIEAEARAKQAEARRIEAVNEAERQAAIAESRRVAAEQEAARRAEEASIKAKMEQERAVEAERQRIAGAQKAEAEEAEKRAKNRAHQAAVNREILAALVALNIAEDGAKIIIAAIAKGAVPHVSILY